jgi:hypothetical protein
MNCNLSTSPSVKGTDIVPSAARLQVSRAFLLQQAAWLYERELSQIQAQMRKVGTGGLVGLNTSLSAAPAGSPSPGGSQSPATQIPPPVKVSSFGITPLQS